MSGRAPRQKGNRLEREVVNLLRSYNLDAKRVPSSGAHHGFPGDVICLDGMQVECKSRARGFSPLYQWLVGNDALVVKQDRHEPLIVMHLSRFARLAQEAQSEAIAPPQSPPTPLNSNHQSHTHSIYDLLQPDLYKSDMKK